MSEKGRNHVKPEDKMTRAEVSGCFALVALGMVCLTILAAIWIVWG